MLDTTDWTIQVIISSGYISESVTQSRYFFQATAKCYEFFESAKIS